MIARLVAWLAAWTNRRLEADEMSITNNVLPRRKGTL